MEEIIENPEEEAEGKLNSFKMIQRLILIRNIQIQKKYWMIFIKDF